MNMTGEMHRAFSVDGVPTGRVGTAEKLNFQTDAYGGVFNRAADNFAGRFPGGAAGSPPLNGHSGDSPVNGLDLEFRGPEALRIRPQPILAG